MQVEIFGSRPYHHEASLIPNTHDLVWGSAVYEGRTLYFTVAVSFLAGKAPFSFPPSWWRISPCAEYEMFPLNKEELRAVAVLDKYGIERPVVEPLFAPRARFEPDDAVFDAYAQDFFLRLVHTPPVFLSQQAGGPMPLTWEASPSEVLPEGYTLGRHRDREGMTLSCGKEQSKDWGVSLSPQFSWIAGERPPHPFEHVCPVQLDRYFPGRAREIIELVKADAKYKVDFARETEIAYAKQTLGMLE